MDYLTFISSSIDWSLILRLLVAIILGGLIGFEREKSHKIAGLRTHALVALGSALLTIVSIQAYNLFPSVNGVPGYDYHLVANIIVGIGFIGAGAIFKRENHVEGTTTAASLWVVAGIGIACGFAFFKEAVFATLAVYVILAFLWIFEKKFAFEFQYKPDKTYEKLKEEQDEIEETVAAK